MIISLSRYTQAQFDLIQNITHLRVRKADDCNAEGERVRPLTQPVSAGMNVARSLIGFGDVITRRYPRSA